MKRIVALVAAAALGFLAYTMVPPAEPAPPDFGTTLPPDPDGATGSPSVWYCPWVDSGALRDSTFDLAAALDVESIITLPSPIPNEEPDSTTEDIAGPGALSLDTASIIRRGESPGIVEFDDGPATASSVVWSDELVTGDRCVVSVPKVWHIGGGTTADGFTLNLRIFNPFPENAKITVTALSEFGVEPLPELTGLDVPGRSWITEDLTRTLQLLDQVSFTVTTEQGLVIPSLVLAAYDEDDTLIDEASWPGTGLARTWDFPATTDGGLEPILIVTNDGAADATVTIDVFTPAGAIIGASEQLAPAGFPTRIPLGDLAEAPFGIRVTSSVPVAAVVEARIPEVSEEIPEEAASTTTSEAAEGGDEAPAGPRGLAGTVGLVDASTRWLIPGPGTTPDTTSTIWIMNTGSEQATVTVTPLGQSGALPADKVVVPAGSVAAYVAAFGAADGYEVTSNVEVSVSWSISGPRGVALLAGVAVGE